MNIHKLVYAVKHIAWPIWGSDELLYCTVAVTCMLVLSRLGAFLAIDPEYVISNITDEKRVTSSELTSNTFGIYCILGRVSVWVAA